LPPNCRAGGGGQDIVNFESWIIDVDGPKTDIVQNWTKFGETKTKIGHPNTDTESSSRQKLADETLKSQHKGLRLGPTDIPVRVSRHAVVRSLTS